MVQMWHMWHWKYWKYWKWNPRQHYTVSTQYTDFWFDELWPRPPALHDAHATSGEVRWPRRSCNPSRVFKMRPKENRERERERAMNLWGWSYMINFLFFSYFGFLHFVNRWIYGQLCPRVQPYFEIKTCTLVLGYLQISPCWARIFQPRHSWQSIPLQWLRHGSALRRLNFNARVLSAAWDHCLFTGVVMSVISCGTLEKHIHFSWAVHWAKSYLQLPL